MGTRNRLELGDARIIQDDSGESPPKSAIVVLDRRARLEVDPARVGKTKVGLSVFFGTFRVGVVGVYLDKDAGAEEDAREIATLIEDLNCPNVLVAGDFNAKSPWWGCEAEDERGAALADLATVAGLQVENVGNVPTFLVHRQGREYRSIVDVTMASATLSPRIRRWRVDPDLGPVGPQAHPV